MPGKIQTAASGDNRVQVDGPELFLCTDQKLGQSFLDMCQMSLVIREDNVSFLIQDGNLYRSRTDINSK